MKAFDLVIENAAILTMDANETIIKNGTIGVKNADNIDTTIVNGEVVYSKGAFSCGVDEAQPARQVMTEMQDYSYL